MNTEETIVLSTRKSRAPNANILIPYTPPAKLQLERSDRQYTIAENGVAIGTVTLEDNGDIVFKGDREKSALVIGLLFLNTIGSGDGLTMEFPPLIPAIITWNVR